MEAGCVATRQEGIPNGNTALRGRSVKKWYFRLMHLSFKVREVRLAARCECGAWRWCSSPWPLEAVVWVNPLTRQMAASVTFN